MRAADRATLGPARPRRRRSGAHREEGIALLVVLVVIALIGTISIETQYLTRIDARIASNVATDTRYYYLAKSGVEAARNILREDRRDNAIDHLGETWAIPIGFPLEGSLLSLDMIDEERKIPLNPLVQEGEDGREQVPNVDVQAALTALCDRLGIEPSAIAALFDWIDRDDLPFGGEGAEIGFYERLDPPYRPRNAPLNTLLELRMVRGFDAEAFQKIQPFVSVYPDQTTVNVNTAPPEVLLSLMPEADELLVEDLVEHRFEEPFETRDALREYLEGYGVFSNPTELVQRFRTESVHFSIKSVVQPIPGEALDPTLPGNVKVLTAIVRRTSDGSTELLYWRTN